MEVEVCEYCYLVDKCPVLNKAECPINLLWAKVAELDEAKRLLTAKAVRTITYQELAQSYGLSRN